MMSETEQTRQEKETKSQPVVSFTSLPYEIIENILARVSRWNHLKLSLVSKSFRLLLSSTELYKTRSQIGANETCVYVCLQFLNGPRWFSLLEKPIQTRTKRRGKIEFEEKPNQTGTKDRGKIKFEENSSGNLLVPIPCSCHSLPIPDVYPLSKRHTCTIAVGFEIYVIGGFLGYVSSAVRILDCRSNTWREAPTMTVARTCPSADFLDEKIYVMGGCGIGKYDNWMEVFDIKTQSWTAFPSPPELPECFYLVPGKLHVVTEENEYTFEPKQGRWKVVGEPSSFLSQDIIVSCVVENVIYCSDYDGFIMWYDDEDGKWEDINGLEELHEHPTRGLENGLLLDLVNHGEKLLVVWECFGDDKEENDIWYAQISLETRCNGHEIWGEVECVDVMPRVPGMSYKFDNCLSVSI